VPPCRARAGSGSIWVMGRKWLVGLGVIVVVAGGGTAAVSAHDKSRSDVIATGVRVAGVDVGGLHAAAARARVQEALNAPLARPIVLRAGGHKFTLSAAKAQERVDVDGLIDQAVALSRGGSLVSRTVDEIKGKRVDTDLPARVSFSKSAVDHLVARAAKRINQAPSDASVSPDASGLKVVASHTGDRLVTSRLTKTITAALGQPGGTRSFRGSVKTVQPATSTDALAKKYPSYIIVDRDHFKLRLYQNLKLWKTYDVAIGMSGLETPAGLYDVQWKQTNPSWYVPNSPWAGKLAGKTIPPGPDDPIKARWMAFDGSAGIHGVDPSEYGSIGHNASHGCVRMRIPDVIEVYDRTPVHTPVFIA
jgi:lipoprotein-anchoring transpeptidase ErfK/SrfK